MNTSAASSNQIILWGTGLLAAVLVLTSLLGIKVPLIQGDRAAFFIVAALGFIMCIFGTWSKNQPIHWLNPIIIAGIVLGFTALVLTLSLIFKFQLPLINSDRTALMALSGIIVLKVVLASVLQFISRTA